METVDIAITERPLDEGLERGEVMDLYDMLGGRQAIPVEYDSAAGSSTAMGFIAIDAAEKIDYRYQADSDIGRYIGGLLGDMELEADGGRYVATAENGGTVRIWLSR